MDRIGSNFPPLADRLELDHADLAVLAGNILAAHTGLDPIMDESDVAAYSESARALKDMARQIEAARKAEKDGILRDGRTIDAFFKAMVAPVTQAADAVVASINAWQRARLESERKAEAERLATEREAARVFDDEPAPVPAPAPVREIARVVTATGRVAAVASTYWRHEVTDPQAVPRQFLMVNEAAIKAAIAQGVREIPGVRIIEDVRTGIRG